MQTFQDASEKAMNGYLIALRLEVNKLLPASFLPITIDRECIWTTAWNGEEFLCTPFYDETDGLSVCHADSGDFTDTKWEVTGNLDVDARSFITNLEAAARYLTGAVG